jgi:hypothetical protein
VRSAEDVDGFVEAELGGVGSARGHHHELVGITFHAPPAA